MHAEAIKTALNDFRITTIRDQTPQWLYAGWKRLADRPEVVVAGWDKCGLRGMFDERKPQLLARVNRALTDVDDPLYPLFPKGDRDTLPADADADEAAAVPPHREEALSDESGDEDTEERADSLLHEEEEQQCVYKRAADADTDMGQPPAKMRCTKLAPMFALAQQRGILAGLDK